MRVFTILTSALGLAVAEQEEVTSAAHLAQIVRREDKPVCARHMLECVKQLEEVEHTHLLQVNKRLEVSNALAEHTNQKNLKQPAQAEPNHNGSKLITVDMDGSLNDWPQVQPYLNCAGGIGLVSHRRKWVTVALALKAATIPGDFVETGVYDGGTTILMSEVMMGSEDKSRLMWAADSWEGLPKEDTSAEKDAQHETEGCTRMAPTASAKEGHEGDYKVSRARFDANLARCGLGNNSRIKPLQGWFKDTLPKAGIDKIAFLRLDGDIFISTWQAISILYDKVVPGG